MSANSNVHSTTIPSKSSSLKKIIARRLYLKNIQPLPGYMPNRFLGKIKKLYDTLSS